MSLQAAKQHVLIHDLKKERGRKRRVLPNIFQMFLFYWIKPSQSRPCGLLIYWFMEPWRETRHRDYLLSDVKISSPACRRLLVHPANIQLSAFLAWGWSWLLVHCRQPSPCFLAVRWIHAQQASPISKLADESTTITTLPSTPLRASPRQAQVTSHAQPARGL
jgi:hypothetical protein